MSSLRAISGLFGVAALAGAALGGVGLGRFAIGEVDPIYSGYRPLMSAAVMREQASFARDFWEQQEAPLRAGASDEATDG